MGGATAALAGRVHGREGEVMPHIISLFGLIYRQCNGNCLFSADRMAGAGGTTALEKASTKSNRTWRCCWWCMATAEFDGLVAWTVEGLPFLILSVVIQGFFFKESVLGFPAAI